MKCGTFSFKTLFRKDLTRFAPFWGGYFLCLILGLLMLADGSTMLAVNLAELPQLMALVNFCYAFLMADLLFGDLYSPRMCSGIHALPLRREGIFAVHTAAGMVFSLIPTAGMTALALVLIQGAEVAGAWQIPLWWLLAANLQYLFFFGLAVLCALWAGNRLGHGLLYAMANLAAAGLGVVADVYYTPLLFGVVTPMESFFRFCPLLGMADSRLMEESYAQDVDFLTLGEGWGYLAACAGVGILLLMAAVFVYRKRKLETAGDLLAVEFLKPLFLVGMSLGTGWALTVFVSSYDVYENNHYFLTALGMILGWFVGKMLLERKIRVFRLKSAAALACLMAVMAVSLLLTRMDIFGISDWVPQAHQVETAQLGFYGWGRTGSVQSAIRFQELALEERLDPELSYNEEYALVRMEYELKNGRRVTRQYCIRVDSEAGEILRKVSSSPEALLGPELLALDWGRQLETVSFASWAGSFELPEEYRTEADLNSLKAAIVADCEAGTMSPYDGFHDTPVFTTGGEAPDTVNGERPTVESTEHWEYSWSVVLDGGDIYRHLNVYSDSENTMKWLKDRGIADSLEESVRDYLAGFRD